MADCTRCGGSGSEPDPVRQGFEDLLTAIRALADGAESNAELERQASHAQTALTVCRSAVQNRTAVHAARITFLSATLRDILGRFGPQLQGEMQIWRASNEDVEAWRRVLDAS